MNLRLKDLADAVAAILAKRWLEQEQRLTAQKLNPSGAPPSIDGHLEKERPRQSQPNRTDKDGL